MESHEIENIIKIFPNDSLKKKRIRRIKKAKGIFIEKKGDEIAGVVFVNILFGFIPTITWITSKRFENRGIATKLIKMAQSNYMLLTAKTRNPVSFHLAEKTGFKRLFGNYWIWVKLW